MTIIKIEVGDEVDIKFSFKKFINRMVSLPPVQDLSGLERIIIKNFIQGNLKNANSKTQAFYYQNQNKKGQIEIILKNIINISIPYYAFVFYPELAALLFSEILFHEIGHHVHFTMRHGIKRSKYERFADQYAKAGYLSYLKSRSSKILSSYKWASLNFLIFEKKERQMFTEARKELITYLSNNRGEAIFP